MQSIIASQLSRLQQVLVMVFTEDFLKGACCAALGCCSVVLWWYCDAQDEKFAGSNPALQFRDFRQLRDYLERCPERQADVLVEGKVKKLRYALYSECAGVEVAALCKFQRRPRLFRRSDMERTLTNSVPFK